MILKSLNGEKKKKNKLFALFFLFLILFTALFESAHGSQNARRLLTEEVKISACVNMHASIYSLYIKPVRLNVAMELLERKKKGRSLLLEKKKKKNLSILLLFFLISMTIICILNVHNPSTYFTFRYIKIEFERLKWYIPVN